MRPAQVLGALAREVRRDAPGTLGKAFMIGRFLARLPLHLHRPITVEGARAAVRARLVTREQRFLDNARRWFYGEAPGPIGALLRAVGCELGDLRALVGREGLEGALCALRDQGVYVTVDEFKGRRPMVRGSTCVESHPDAFRNLLATPDVAASSGGSRSEGTPVLIDLGFIRACAEDNLAFLAARGGAAWDLATWETPGAGARFRLLKLALMPSGARRWFSQVDPASSSIPANNQLSVEGMLWTSRAVKRALPTPIHAPLGQPLAVARWLRETLERGRTPHLFTFPSSAVAMAQAARSAGIDLDGAALTVGGEPVTAARLASLSAAGLDVLPRYGSMETGPIGYGCLRGETSDDVHLVADQQAVIEVGERGQQLGLPAEALLTTCLHPRAPFAFLNVSMGDQAARSDRRCGCPLEQLGWRIHLGDVRSFEKLTAGGMTFFAADVIRVLEEELPARFGGAPTHFQLCEEESDAGSPRLELLIDPAVGTVDAEEALAAFYRALATTSSVGPKMVELWRDGGFVEVVRRRPRTTRSSKVLHLHVNRPARLPEEPRLDDESVVKGS